MYGLQTLLSLSGPLHVKVLVSFRWLRIYFILFCWSAYSRGNEPFSLYVRPTVYYQWSDLWKYAAYTLYNV